MKKHLLNAALAICVIALFVILVEIVSYNLLQMEGYDPIAINNTMFLTQPDAALGYVNAPNTTLFAQAYTRSGKLCYDATYHTDAFGRRNTSQSSAKKHLVLLGDSVTFGEGLEDNQTLSSQLAKHVQDYSIYNYGVSGYGPQHLLSLLEQKELVSQTSSQGIALYIFIPVHVERTRGTTATSWLYDSPYYSFDGKQVRNYTSMKKADPLRVGLYRLFNKLKEHSYFLTLIDTQLPLALSSNDYEHTAVLITKMKRSYESQVNGTFITVLHPGWYNAENRYKKTLALLAQNNITLWDFSDYPYNVSTDTFGCDPHPTAAFNKDFAPLLAQKINSFSRQ